MPYSIRPGSRYVLPPDVPGNVAESSYEPPSAYAGMSIAELDRELAKYAPAVPGAAAGERDGVEGLLQAYDRDEATVAIHDALAQVFGRPVPRPHPAVRAFHLTDESLVDLGAAVQAMSVGERRMPADRAKAVRAAFSSDALPELISTVAFNVASGIVADSLNGDLAWTARASLPNFKQASYGTAIAGKFERAREGQQIEAAQFVLGAEPLQLLRYRADLAISYEAWLSDGREVLRALVAAQAGAAARQLRRDAFAVLTSNADLADGTPLFDNSRGNNVSASLDAAGVGDGVAALAKLAGVDGELLDAKAVYLIVPTDDFATAHALNQSMGQPLRVIATPHVADSSYYLAADPLLCPAVCLAQMDGSDTPFSLVRLSDSDDADAVRFAASLVYDIAPVSSHIIKVS